jgi:hypothetical protein
MAKSTIPDPLGLRKRVEQVAKAVPGVGRRRAQTPAEKALSAVRDLAGTVQDRLSGGPAKRSEAAKKAVRTRTTKARSRSTAAKKGAATRARKR